MSANDWLVLGAGRAGRTLARLLHADGSLLALWNRSLPDSLAQPAGVDGALPIRISPSPDVDPRARVVVLAVRDDASTTLVRQLPEPVRADPHRVWLGLSGAGGCAPFRDHVAGSVGNVHPLMALTGGRDDLERLRDAFFAVDGDARARAACEHLVRLAGGRSAFIPADKRVAYHLGAVLAGNGVFALLEAARRVAEHAGIESEALHAGYARLAEASARASLLAGLEQAQTGPTARGDVGTVAAHLEWLSTHLASDRALYERLTDLLVDVAARRGLAPERVQAVRELLQAPAQEPPA